MFRSFVYLFIYFDYTKIGTDGGGLCVQVDALSDAIPSRRICNSLVGCCNLKPVLRALDCSARN